MQRRLWAASVLCAVLAACPPPTQPLDAGRLDVPAADGVATDAPARDAVVVPDAPSDGVTAMDVPLDTLCPVPDADGDGHRSIACGGDDCDDTDPHRWPGNPEVCGVTTVATADGGTMLVRTDPATGLDPTHDEDCDPTTFASAAMHDGDHDGDGFIDVACSNTDRSGMVNHGTDCQDLATQYGFAGTTVMTTVQPLDIHPTQAEVCNGVDDNCNGMVDEGVQQNFYPDCDGDMYGDSTDTGMLACFGAQLTACMGHPPVADHTDCSDTHANVHPGAVEVCDMARVDENCNGMVNEGCTCPYVGATQSCCGSRGMQTCQMTAMGAAWATCSVTPVAEICNGVDDNCDGAVDNGATCAVAGESCTAGACVCPSGQTACGGSCQSLGGTCTGSAPPGTCAQSGSWVCSGGTRVCSAPAPTPQATCWLDCDNDGYTGGTTTTTCTGCGSVPLPGGCTGHWSPSPSGSDCNDNNPYANTACTLSGSEPSVGHCCCLGCSQANPRISDYSVCPTGFHVASCTYNRQSGSGGLNAYSIDSATCELSQGCNGCDGVTASLNWSCVAN